MDDPKLVAPWQRFGARDLRRAGLWGLAAGIALTFAVLTATSDNGRQRLAFVGTKTQLAAAPTKPAEDAAVRRLTDIVHSLAIDYDRQATRLDVLERNVGEITGSIGRLAAAQPAPPASSPPQASMPLPASAPAPAPTLPPVIAPPEVAPAAVPPEATPADVPPAEVTSIVAPQDSTVPSKPGRREFGIDLGGAANVDGLRAIWATTKARHGGLLIGLYPIVAIRETARSAGTQYRLVIGPLPNAASAARLCSVIVRSDALCHPAVFDGQRLASN